MIMPINLATPVANKVVKNNLPKSVRIEKLQNLIKEFEECAKGCPKNETLANHIAYLKKSLTKLIEE